MAWSIRCADTATAQSDSKKWDDSKTHFRIHFSAPELSNFPLKYRLKAEISSLRQQPFPTTRF